ncbi:cupin domain-containing protein [Streptomyces sp. NPDC002519]
MLPTTSSRSVRWSVQAGTGRRDRQPHRHEGFEIIYVFSGQLETDAGAHPAGGLLVMEPGSIHVPHSLQGAVMLVVWEQPVTTL